MILYLPKNFNANEWFILIAGTLLLALVLLLPKRMSFIEMLLIWLFNILLTESADFFIGVPPLDLYDFNDWPQYEVFDLLLYLFMYPPIAYFFIYIYDIWKPRKLQAAFLIVVCSLVTTALEGCSIKFYVFTYKGWSLPYSFPTYILVFVLNLLLYRFMKAKLLTIYRSN
ncbi:hypothetical protein ACFQZT_14295 [Paenibacillus sp. GCM10027628]|uniref:hypothetical protein n=1 Tax=Paenibacillus sp. GCM10027628 TaxID=3273413 RepID=UPI00363B83E7